MRLGPRALQRVRREFYPADYARAIALLTRWSTKSCAPGEAPARMHAAALNVALGKVPALKRAFGMARGDFRDLLILGDDPDFSRPSVVYEPGEAPLSSIEKAFLEAIRRKPADNGIRLVYADWLEEHGDDQRAQYLRVLCQWIAGDPDADRVLIKRERELRKGLPRWWLAWIRESACARNARGRKRTGR